MKIVAYLENQVFGRYRALKERRDGPISRIMKPFADIGLSADIFSLVGLACGVISAGFLNHSKLWFILFWILKRAFDIVDGPLARISDKELVPNVNMDHISDLTFSMILLAATIPIVGPILPVIALLAHIIHIVFDTAGIGKSLFGPSNYAQFFFLVDLINLGLIFQMIFSVMAFCIRVILKRK